MNVSDNFRMQKSDGTSSLNAADFLFDKSLSEG